MIEIEDMWKYQHDVCLIVGSVLKEGILQLEENYYDTVRQRTWFMS